MNSQLLTHLQTAAQLLEIDPTSRLGKDLQTLVDKSNRTNYQVAVFGPFNHGKSTLLNAILGQKTLPIDLIPTTGAAIKVVYGEEIATKITLNNGQIKSAAGTEILTEFAILDGDRRMRDDVVEVEVSFPHPLLAAGVELIDLPGTNDRAEQDRFVCDRLLAADLIINVLDVRKLMTLGEREHLRDWLENRGINTVVFVANFSNMLTPTEQKDVQNRLRFVAESFRSKLPSGISNLYRVDALPALRARLKGDDSTLHTSGLPSFLSALQSIVSHHQAELSAVRMPAAETIGTEFQNLLETKIHQLTTEIDTINNKRQQEFKLKQQAQQLIKTGWETSLKEIEQWLYLPNLVSFYQTPLTTAIRQHTFTDWETNNVVVRIQSAQREINDWLVKGSSFFEVTAVEPLQIKLPSPPEVLLPDTPPSKPTDPLPSLDNLTPTAIATGLGWMLGGPLGAVVAGGASTIASKISGDPSPPPRVDYTDEINAAHTDAAADYLLRLNMDAMATLQSYRDRARVAIAPSLSLDRSIDPTLSAKLTSYQTCLSNLRV
jgi:GTPase SAR1 family protein